MDKTSLKFASDEEGSLLIWTPPLDIVADSQPVESFVIPYQSRPGGALFAVPACFLDENYLVEANSNDDESGLLGPSHLFYSDLIEEAEDATVVGVGRTAPVVLVDLADEALEGMREYDPVTDSTAHFCPFDEEKESAIVSLKDIDAAVKNWVDGIASGRQNFYSAREEPPAVKAHPKKQQKKVSNAALADQVAGLMAQIQLLAAQQQEIRDSFQPPASATHADVGLSGKSQPVVPNVAHFQGGYSEVDFAVGGTSSKNSGAYDSTGCPRCFGRGRGDGSFGGRKLRSECINSYHSFGWLWGIPSASWLLAEEGQAVFQGKEWHVGKRCSPNLHQALRVTSWQYISFSRRCSHRRQSLGPKQTSSIQEQRCVPTWRNMATSKAALTMWILAHAFDSAGRDDFRTCKEFLALLAASLDQASLDGNWSIAYLISLLEEPTSQMMMERHSPLSSLGRPFAGMVPPQWSAVALAYIREMDLLQSKKTKPGRSLGRRRSRHRQREGRSSRRSRSLWRGVPTSEYAVWQW